jgi:hypothetical protein
MPDHARLTVCRDAGAGTAAAGELWYFRSPTFSVLSRCTVVAEFATHDGERSEVHRRLRSEEYFVIGPHGDDSQIGSYYPTAEAAVEDALNRWAARNAAN